MAESNCGEDPARKFLIDGGWVVTGHGPGSRILPKGAVVWSGGRILAVGPEDELRTAHPRAKRLDAHGGVILPGFINLHHHFYSSLARGLDPGVEIKTFPQVLDRLWWRLDRALDAETVTLSAELAAAESVRAGCTTVFDHHASPAVIPGSLDLLAGAVERHGLSALLCYEISDRNGHDEALAGLEENLRFLDQRRDDPRIRGTVGLHACFTLREETLQVVARRRPVNSGCHIHVAEHPVDFTTNREIFGRGPIQRLAAYGLLDRFCLVAHGIHLGTQSYHMIADHDATLIHNPESNANNGVGHLNLELVRRIGCRVGLGTDGMSGSIPRALRLAFLLRRLASGDPSTGFKSGPALLEANVETARRFFNEPLLGELVPGAPADITVLDAPPPTPLVSENYFAHLVYGLAEAPVRHTVARGEVVYEDFQHTRIDLAELAARARRQAPALWRRFHGLGYGTAYLGDADGGSK